MKVIDSHGADALRLYLINSPVVRAESLKFKEEGVQATVREVLLPWFNAFRFFVQQVCMGGSNDEDVFKCDRCTEVFISILAEKLPVPWGLCVRAGMLRDMIFAHLGYTSGLWLARRNRRVFLLYMFV